MAVSIAQAVGALTSVPDEEVQKLNDIAVELFIARGDAFIREGTVPQRFAFVGSGLFRYYYVNSRGGEFTKGFFSEGTCIVSYTAMIERRASYYTIEALEDSTVFALDYGAWQQLYRSHPCWSALLIALLTKGYTKKETREREFLLHTAEKRYRSFLAEYPSLEQRIPQRLVASYLGITPVALSRIRRRMRQNAEKKSPR